MWIFTGLIDLIYEKRLKKIGFLLLFLLKILFSAIIGDYSNPKISVNLNVFAFLCR
jgi:hypothetical protein